MTCSSILVEVLSKMCKGWQICQRQPLNFICLLYKELKLNLIIFEGSLRLVSEKILKLSTLCDSVFLFIKEERFVIIICCRSYIRCYSWVSQHFTAIVNQNQMFNKSTCLHNIYIILQKEEKTVKDTGPACPPNQPITGVPTSKPTNGNLGGDDEGVANWNPVHSLINIIYYYY